MRSLVKNDQALLFQLLVGAAMAIIIFFAILNIGTFINGTIAQTFIDDLPTNVASGSVNTTTWNNRTADTTAHTTSITLPIDASTFDNELSKFYILANGSALDFDLEVNGDQVNTSQNVSSGAGFNVTFKYLIANGSINNSDTTLNFRWNVTGTDGAGNAYVRYASTSYFVSNDYRTYLQNMSYTTMVNLSGDYDNVVDSLAIAAVVMAITLPLAAVVAIRKFF